MSHQFFTGGGVRLLASGPPTSRLCIAPSQSVAYPSGNYESEKGCAGPVSLIYHCEKTFGGPKLVRFVLLVGEKSGGKNVCAFGGCQRPYFVEYARSHLNPEAKRLKARSVLGWGTAWEALRVLLAFCFHVEQILCGRVVRESFAFASGHTSSNTPGLI